ncbi:MULTISPECIES: pyridoxamine 5'-phosphate oxidase family protein [Acinetobacter]|jgi:general stress protein 26|uniref:pyridoxamine 5'-phosphate oxidase family protein n=1 Tax=Acinetobacter TaxID=469 RepID=UPI00079FE36E|nr:MULTISPECIES: pyridoxamine 5'-phosphate oxidase family protein [Acinetobacter]KYQ83316.1 general stress protein [Acinetobacter sp. NRRL B-65365]MEB6479022.1 pyridoxamine 5'-phosphate oxidase family protein [Acinetobacter vivianii]MEB6657147.1 pyridoxamine 5'-phosphate oxidase family protein [Acinetobacter vivianii]OEC91557.1 general stress protein [Acinetobacter sp. YK3]RPE31257.1 general stress protein 26 [Acinetobacter sp. BIGb0102]
MNNLNNEYQELNQLLKGIKFAMVTFISEKGHLHSVPMTTQDTDFNGIVWFLGSKSSELVKSIPLNNQVNLGYSNISNNDYVSINGIAECVVDPAILDQIWSPAYEAFFEHGKSDPDIQLLRVICNGAQYWKGSGKVATLFKLAKASITGESEELGTTKNISL